MGPMMYRIAFEPIAHSSVLVLLMAAFGVHFSLTGLGLLFFGPEGSGTAPLSSASFSLGDLVVSGQSIAVLIVTALLLVLFALFFGRTLLGKGIARVFVEPHRGAVGRNPDLRRGANRVCAGRPARRRIGRAGRPADDGVL
jgi:branched-subunit amino acid ABC-type transport system permease component